MGFIYKITNNLTGKCYIGETIKTNPESRWNEHRRKIEKGIGCPALQDAIKKYGVDNFSFKVLLICFDGDRYYYEKEYIKKYNSIVPNGYNLTSGGEGGGFYGKKHSDETKLKITEGLKQRYNDNPELREETSNRLKELYKNPENIEKLKDGMKNSEVFKNLKKNENGFGFAKIKVKQYTIEGEFVKEYNSLAEAGDAVNISHRGISKCINGKQKSCGGFKWIKSE
jgi:group I intron endonuclease